MSTVRKIGTVTLNGVTYDLAMNDSAYLGLEGRDLYDRPATREVTIDEAATGSGTEPYFRDTIHQLLDALAITMKERDAALASLHRSGSEEGLTGRSAGA
jgi:hypothetical protein